MTEFEAKEALFHLHKEYMNHTPKERLVLYDEYMKKRNEIKEALIEYISQIKLGKIKTR